MMGIFLPTLMGAVLVLGCGSDENKAALADTGAAPSPTSESDADADADDDDDADTAADEDADTGIGTDTGTVTEACFNLSGGTAWLDYGADGVHDADIQVLLTFDDDDNITSYLQDMDFPFMDGYQIISTTYAYNEAGNQTQCEETNETNHSSTGTTLEAKQKTWAYEDGRVIEHVARYDRQSDGIWDDSETSLYSYNSDGDTTQEVTEVVDNNDPSLDYGFVVTHRYDADANRKETVTRHDERLDGTVDQTDHNTWSHTDGLVTQQLSGTDADGDGILDGWESSIFTYDEDGQVIESTTGQDFDGDFVWESLSTTYSTYNADGDITEQEVLADTDSDGRWDRVTLYTTTYDADGNITEQDETLDQDMDGVLDFIRTISYVYEASGRLRSSREVTDSGADGWHDFIRTNTYTYDDNGYLIGETNQSVRYTPSPDGSLDTYTYTRDEHGNVIVEFRETDHDLDGTIDELSYVSFEWEPCNREDTSAWLEREADVLSQCARFTVD